MSQVDIVVSCPLAQDLPLHIHQPLQQESGRGRIRCAPAWVVRGRGGPPERAPPRRATFTEPPVLPREMARLPPPPTERRDPVTGAPPRCCLSCAIEERGSNRGGFVGAVRLVRVIEREVVGGIGNVSIERRWLELKSSKQTINTHRKNLSKAWLLSLCIQ